VRRERRQAQATTERLSGREREVLTLVAEGLSDKEIADRLVLSPHTVHRHVANVRTKLRQPSRAAAAAHATRTGLI
jgi:DNA-binding NarL/FixJ family response regulator